MGEEEEKLLLSLLNGEFSSLTISFNDAHAPNYCTAKTWLKEGPDSGGYTDLDDWVSEEERDAAIENNTVWQAHWYPDTPVGFYSLMASSLPALLAGLRKTKC